MNYAHSTLTLTLTLAAQVACTGQSTSTQPAQETATAWLALTDSGQNAASWDAAASPFKAAVTKAAWDAAMQGFRAPLGAVKSRKLKSATYTRAMPGMPDGEYVVIQFDTSFENKAAAVETITPMRDKDGAWKVSGYFVK